MIQRKEVKHLESENRKVMATFQILEDGVAGKNKGDKIKIHDQKMRKRESIPRTALQPINNRIKYNPKRAKLSADCENAENVPVNIETKKATQIKAGERRENADKQKRVQIKEGRRENLEKHLECLDLVHKEQKRAQIKEGKREAVEDLEFHSEYLRDIWSYLMDMESKVQWPKANYMAKQVHLNNSMRCVLVDWLVGVADEYNMSDQTLHLSINYIDRFLSQMSVVKDKFQLLGSAAMMLAGKVEDIYPPDSKEWAYLTGNTYTSHQVQRMEMLLLKVLKFDLQPPTTLAFIQHMCVEHKLDKDTMYLAMYISELILLEGDDYLNYSPSKLAAAAVVLARFLLSKKHPWPRKLENSCGYTLKQLSPVVQRQNRTFTDSPTKPQQAIQTKYQSPKYHKVALLEPKILDLDESDAE